jgi:hypothetical protein
VLFSWSQTLNKWIRYVIDDSSRINSLCYRYHGWHGDFCRVPTALEFTVEKNYKMTTVALVFVSFSCRRQCHR